MTHVIRGEATSSRTIEWVACRVIYSRSIDNNDVGQTVDHRLAIWKPVKNLLTAQMT